MRSLTLITNDEIEKFRLNFSRCTNGDMAPLTVHCTGDDFQGEVHLEQKNIYWLGGNIMAVTWEVTIFISPPRRKIINGSSSFLGQPYMYKNNESEV